MGYKYFFKYWSKSNHLLHWPRIEEGKTNPRGAKKGRPFLCQVYRANCCSSIRLLAESLHDLLVYTSLFFSCGLKKNSFISKCNAKNQTVVR